MHLTYRIAKVSDMRPCFHCFGEDFDPDVEVRSGLPAVWDRLHTLGSLTMLVVEDEDRPSHERLLWHGSNVFVNDWFMAEARQGSQPHLGGQVVSRILSGKSPVLGPALIREANSGRGLNLFTLHYSLNENSLNPQEARLVRAKAVEAYHKAFEGYHLKEILTEVYGEERRKLLLAGGFLLRADYSGHDVAGWLPKRRPYLLGVNRAEALANEGCLISALFVYTPPRFFFKPGEQTLLQRALVGETDAELACSLGLAASTVKTRWRTIYERVREVSPGWLPAPDTHSEAPKRGQEKRRPLLAYLRHHPEELRPAIPPPLLRLPCPAPVPSSSASRDSFENLEDEDRDQETRLLFRV